MKARAARQPAPVLPAAILDDLQHVEARLEVEIGSREGRLEDIARHLVGAGGKRVRPVVVLLIYHAAAEDRLERRADAVDAATALELIHSATLLHDDIIDGCETRRGRPSALRAFGLADSLVAGDFLFSRAFALCASFEPAVIRWAAAACISLTEGEILQSRFRRNPGVGPADHAEIVRRKTASLFEAGARTAAHLAGAPEHVVAAMASCGHHVGVAFQLSDDLLDVVGHPSVTGKPRGIDLRDGNPSLPIVLALGADPGLAEIFRRSDLSSAEVEAGLERIARTGVLDVVARHARDHVAAALAEIGVLPPSPHRDALETLADGLTERIA